MSPGQSNCLIAVREQPLVVVAFYREISVSYLTINFVHKTGLCMCLSAVTPVTLGCVSGNLPTTVY